jgi:S-adenosylmethionine synthetase
MATNGTNGVDANGVSGWKHYNEGTFLFTVSSVPAPA